jgi:membrane-associated protease RseP (regulator of RpoE activity)
VICAGVVMNVITAAVLFICVFMHGLETEPAKLGYVEPGKPASRARASDPAIPAGLRAGDTVLSINGRRAQSFNDLMMASAMSGRGEPMRIVVQRPGLPAPVAFEVTPETSDQTRLMEIGVTPAFSSVLPEAKTQAERAELKRRWESLGLPELEPGMRLVRIGAKTDILGAADLIDAARASGGSPVEAEFVGQSSKAVVLKITPKAQLQTGIITIGSESIAVSHLLGLMPLMRVEGGTEPGQEPQQGLRQGDILARVGAIEFPNIAAGMAEIHRFRGKTIQIDVLRADAKAPARISIVPEPMVKP